MKKVTLLLLSLLFVTGSFAQSVGINSNGTPPDASAMLDVSSTSKGFLTPRMTQAQRTDISPAATGLLVYQTDGSVGYYYYDGSSWLQISSSATVTTPAGIISQFAGASAPDGYLLCQGQAVSRTTYAALFQVISTTYGSGDGSTTFNLPDLRTRVPVGLNSTGTFNALNNKGGAETHTITQAQLPNYTLTNTLSVNTTNSNHTHSGTTNTDGSHSHSLSKQVSAYSTTYHDNSANIYEGGAYRYGLMEAVTATTTGSTHNHSFSISSSGSHTHGISGSVTSGGSGSAIPIVQPYIVLNYIIKY
ncbi:MAG: phage tail protein [Bacteroidetes bacterium]|nr:phage tail protein [Bacteroidota bacterium]